MQFDTINTYIEHTSITERVANKLRISIIKGDLPSGTKLTEQKVSKMLNVSTTPVREAFRTLEAENLLIHSPYSGVAVAEITPKYLVDICEMRELLDKSSSDLIIGNVTNDDIKYLNTIIDKLKMLNPKIIHMENPDESERFIKIEAEFHIYISHISQNLELENIMRNLLKKAHVFRLMLATTFSDTNHMEQTISELNNIVLALENRDKEAFINSISAHYERSKNKNMELLKILKSESNPII